jgi:iron donor protein CyaY
MDLTSYRRLTSLVFEALQDRLDPFPDLLDFEFGQGKLVIRPLNGKPPYVLNTQQAALQLWLAGEAQAWHFDWDQEQQRWWDGRHGVELFSLLAERLSALCATTLSLQP